jgi:ABC-type transport system involved in multi-copper enzyme maturation permease subunit
MATTTLTLETRVRRPPLWRLAVIELRKMVDTRSGVALLIVIEVLAAVAAAVEMLTAKQGARDLGTFLDGAMVPVSILLPVLGILSVTSELSQRTALTTFALVPRRGRIVAAKMLAAALLALACVAAGLATAVAANGLGLAVGRGGGWHLGGSTLAGVAVVEVIFVLMGVAFGALLRSSPVAIVVYFVIPTAWTILGGTVSWLRGWAAWLDLNTTVQPLQHGATMTGWSWAQLAVSVWLWVALPLLAGLARLLRGEVR